MSEKLSVRLKENTSRLDDILNLDINFDIIRKGIRTGGRDACIYFIDGFLEESVMEKLLEFFYKLKPEELPMTAQQMADHVVPYVEVSAMEELDEILKNLLSGVTCLFIDGYDACIGLDCRSYPMRSVDEPSKDKGPPGVKRRLCGNPGLQHSPDSKTNPEPSSVHGNDDGGKNIRNGHRSLLYVRAGGPAALTGAERKNQRDPGRCPDHEPGESGRVHLRAGNGITHFQNSNSPSARTQPQRLSWREIQ